MGTISDVLLDVSRGSPLMTAARHHGVPYYKAYRASKEAGVKLHSRATTRIPGKPSAEFAMQRACHLIGADVQAILSQSRRKHLVRDRMTLSMVLLGLGYSLPVIGRLLGRDHSTILHHRDKFISASDPIAENRVNQLIDAVLDATMQHMTQEG